MSAEESPRHRQINELGAVKSIFGEDVRDLRKKSAWNKWQPLHIAITLRPTKGASGINEVHVQVDLYILASETYPESVPTISLKNSKGLSDHDLEQLKEDLISKAEQYKGFEAIFLLAQYVEEFLHKHNKPAAKSFYDEMVQHQKEKEAKMQHAKQLQDDKERLLIREEIENREAIRKSEADILKKARCNSGTFRDDEDRRNSFSNTSFDSDDCECHHKEVALIVVGTRKIQRGRCLKHSSINHVVYIGMDVNTGETILLSEWIIPNANSSQTQRQLSSIEQEFNFLTRVKGRKVGQYLAFKCQVDSENKTIVYVLKEFIQGLNCLCFMNETFNNNINFIRLLFKGALVALDFLHKQNVVHKDFKASRIYFREKGSLCITNFGIHKRLSDLASQVVSSSNNYSKKTDVYDFGVFLLSFLKGVPINGDSTIPTSIPPDLHDFISRCLCEEKKRPTTTELLTHSFFESQHTFTRQTTQNDDIPERDPSPDLPLSNGRTGESRMTVDFECLQDLGSGAFGSVIKVRKRLDGQYYAIKKIRLNPRNRQLSKKIAKEAQLLSKLNHENVVRYYNSWVEEEKDSNESIEEEESSLEFEDVKRRPQAVKNRDFTFTDDIEAIAPPIQSVSTTFNSKSQAAYSTNFDSESSDDDNWGIYNAPPDSDGIEFEADPEAQSSSEKSSHSNAAPSLDTRKTEWLYIQMEFCGNRNLRDIIDEGICLDLDKAWRMFREIVEGLAYIHEQGMIHRDLKPVNVFMDSHLHVKIGDFGLATNIKSKTNDALLFPLPVQEENPVDESKTGRIGTALYVAPEVGVGSKAVYNQKVDIYSLGIILFEMFYKPMETGMERITVLTGLRKPEIYLPDDFNVKENEKQVALVRWMLEHDSSKRPTCSDLLQSDSMPPPEWAECELRELIRCTLRKPQSIGYKYLISSLFQQNLTTAQDLTYDKDPCAATRPLQLYSYVRKVIVKVFENHGGQNLATPLLMPKSPYYTEVDSCVRLMTNFGGIVCLPHDLRAPFARYIAWNGIYHLRRYSIERVYREKKVSGFLPRELYECAFDIVAPTAGNFIFDAEILSIVYEIMKELSGLKNRQFTIRLNHRLLLDAIFLHFGIKDKEEEVLTLISQLKDGKISRNYFETNLASFGLSDVSITNLSNILHSDYDVSKASNHLQCITKKKTEAGVFARQALQELKTIAQNAETFGVKFEKVITPGMVYNSNRYSGMICQVVGESQKKNRNPNMEVFAAGGRYDSMITSYRKMIEDANMIKPDEKQQSAVGISLSLDKLVQTAVRQHSEEVPKMEPWNVVLCSMNAKPLLTEKTKVLASLWRSGIRCTIIEASNWDQMMEQSNILNIPIVIMLMKTQLKVIATVRCWDRERFQERCFELDELAENVPKMIANWREGNHEFIPTTKSESKSETRSNHVEKGEHDANVDVLFLDKFSSNARKRSEAQIRAQLESVFKRINGAVLVIGLNVESAVLKTIACLLEIEPEQHFNKSVKKIVECHQRHKQYIISTCEEIRGQKMKRTKPIIILFSLPDSLHTLII